MKVLLALLLALEEAIVAVSASGPVSLLEVRWAKEMGLAAKNASVITVAEDIVLSRVVLQRYQETYAVKEEEMAPYLKRAEQLRLPASFYKPFIKGFILLSRVKQLKFGADEKTYLMWRKSELKRQGFKVIFSPPLQK